MAFLKKSSTFFLSFFFLLWGILCLFLEAGITSRPPAPAFILLLDVLFNLVGNAGSLWEKGRIPLFFLLFWTCSHCVCFPFSASLRRHLPKAEREGRRRAAQKIRLVPEKSLHKRREGTEKYGGARRNKCGWIGGRRRMGRGPPPPHPAAPPTTPPTLEA